MIVCRVCTVDGSHQWLISSHDKNRHPLSVQLNPSFSGCFLFFLCANRNYAPKLRNPAKPEHLTCTRLNYEGYETCKLDQPEPNPPYSPRLKSVDLTLYEKRNDTRRRHDVGQHFLSSGAQLFSSSALSRELSRRGVFSSLALNSTHVSAAEREASLAQLIFFRLIPRLDGNA